jgi:hypothetical protein
MQAYAVEVCRTEHRALGLSVVISRATLRYFQISVVVLYNPFNTRIILI